MTDVNTKPKRGRPFGTFGPRRRQQELVRSYTNALGGKLTPIQESDIARAVALQTIAEGTRTRIEKTGGSPDEIRALARLEAVADSAVKRLRLPK
jgi:hypothetical protein